MANHLIPLQIEGKQNNLEHTVSCADSEDAHQCYVTARKRLLDPGSWHQLAGILSGEFLLVDEQGKQVHRAAQEGDLIRIDIPGPGSRQGEGYDWVRVELTEQGVFRAHDEESCALRLRPSVNPGSDKSDVAHFFKQTATSTFIIRRVGNKVIASYHGRNEQPNLGTSDKLDNLRNAFITSGAMAGLSEAQWSALIKAFIT